MFEPFRPQLSPREAEVIQLVADGLADKEIAARLSISPRTVADHITNIRDKLGAANRTSAVYRYFFRALAQRTQPTHATPGQYPPVMTEVPKITLRQAFPDSDIPELAPTAFQIFSSTYYGSGSFFNLVTEKTIVGRLAEGMADPHSRFRIATGEDGRVLGYSQLGHEPHDTSGHYNVTIIVKQDQRTRGVGSALHDDALMYCASTGAGQLHMLIADHNRAALRFAFKRGYVPIDHFLAFELDLTRFDESRFGGLMDFVAQSGVRITNVGEFANSADARRKLFQLNAWCATLDLPGVKDKPAWDSFEQFNEAVCKSSWYQHEGQIVAIDTATNEWIGMAATTVNANGASNLHTGVDRRYRHNSLIGQALKLASIQYAKRKGAARLRDDNTTRDSTNLSINFVMGYEIKAGLIKLEKTLKS